MSEPTREFVVRGRKRQAVSSPEGGRLADEDTGTKRGCDMYVGPGIGTLQTGLWYAAAYEAYIPEILHLRTLGLLRKNMQRSHGSLDSRSKRVEILTLYHDTLPDGTVLKELLRDAVTHRDRVQLIKTSMNEPTFEAFKVLEIAGLPEPRDVVFSSTATANSGNNDAMTTALDIIGRTGDVTLHRSSTVNSTGKTGVSKVTARNKAVQFDEHCKRCQWATLGRCLALQFMNLTEGFMQLGCRPCSGDEEAVLESLISSEVMPASIGITPVYDRMYHWGCISQSWTTNVLGNHVSQWAVHEEWNAIMTLAMMWHATMTAKPGGQVCLKIRFFKRAETLGMTALFSNLFQQCTLTENSRQTCYFVVGVFNGMTGDEALRLNVASVLWRAMDQTPEHIFQCELMQTPRSREMLPICTRMRDVMQVELSKFYSVFLIGLRCLVQTLKTGNWDPLTKDLKRVLDRVYSKEASDYFLSEWTKSVHGMHTHEREMLMSVMDKPWMCAVC